jgi:hypothetical protein
MYKFFGKSSLFDIWGDFIVYRNLVPADQRLPAVSELRKHLSLQSPHLPRKTDPDYASVVAEQLRQARRIEMPGAALKRLVFIGDTRLLDATAFQNLCAAGGWQGWAFIGRDEMGSERSDVVEEGVYASNRWSALPDFIAFLEKRGFGLDEQTVLVIDMDKTSVGARGRNDRVVDEARLEGVRLTVAGLLGKFFNEDAFRVVYHELNRPAYHAFTADNQDYLAYICLMLGTGLFEFPVFMQDIQDGKMRDFFEFIQQVQARRTELPFAGLAAIHDQVWRLVQEGDPTPFKAFRYNEYLATAARFGMSPGEALETALIQRILITEEVRRLAHDLRQRGALVFGLSDKPDEASFPLPEQAIKGMLPLHRLETLCVGEA